MTERLFKVLNGDGTAFHGGNGTWSLPANGKPGEWMPPIVGELIPCENGYHLCREKDLVYWIGPAIFAAEYRGERIDCDDKVVVREAQLPFQYTNWNERTARLFACDCVERVLHLCSDDERSRKAIAVARRYANGEATDKELAAAWADARAAARDAAWAAARAAEREWQTARLFEVLSGN